MFVILFVCYLSLPSNKLIDLLNWSHLIRGRALINYVMSRVANCLLRSCCTRDTQFHYYIKAHYTCREPHIVTW